MGPEWPEPRTVQHWPGKMLSEIANKVPTRLQYDDNTNQVKSWGFLCEVDDPDANIIETFKLHLDPEYKDPRPEATSLKQARQYYQDYLRCLHDYIENMFAEQYKGWRSLRCEFIFSVPTTWTSPALIAQTIALIKSAGFGGDRTNHHAVIGLTEAEAAAVYASKQRFDKDEVILVCDAGGGTTDVNVLKLDSYRGEATKLQQLGWVEGRAIGSALIDMKFKQQLSERLDKIASYLMHDPDTTAENMMTQGKFERLKCSFGSNATSNLPTIPLNVTGMAAGMAFPTLKIEDSKMTINMEELQTLFDFQIEKMLKLVDEQLAKTEEKHPGTRISHLVLSGGLGSSPYVRKRLHSHFDTGSSSHRSSVEDMEIRTVAEPQLAVVHGLVMDRVQLLARKEVVFKERCCRISYGIVYRALRDPRNPAHIGRKIMVDSRDRKEYVENQVMWFVRQGQSVSSEGVTKPFYINFRPGEENQVWRCKVAMSEEKGNKLPANLSEYGVEEVCSIEWVIKDGVVGKKTKNRHWWQCRPKYIRFEFDVKVVLGPADIKFQLQTKDQKVFSKEHEGIKVTWYAPNEASASVPHMEEPPLIGIYSGEK